MVIIEIDTFTKFCITCKIVKRLLIHSDFYPWKHCSPELIGVQFSHSADHSLSGYIVFGQSFQTPLSWRLPACLCVCVHARTCAQSCLLAHHEEGSVLHAVQMKLVLLKVSYYPEAFFKNWETRVLLREQLTRRGKDEILKRGWHFVHPAVCWWACGPLPFEVEGIPLVKYEASGAFPWLLVKRGRRASLVYTQAFCIWKTLMSCKFQRIITFQDHRVK